MTAKYALSRKEAAELLEVSTRTLDRYIRSKKLSARKKGGAIMLSEEEVQNLKVAKFQKMHGASPKGPGRVHRHVNSTESVQTIFDAETGQVERAPVKTQKKAESAREQVFE